MKYNTIEIEERRARNEASSLLLTMKGNGNGMNMIMGMNLGQTLVSQLNQQAQTQALFKITGEAVSRTLHRGRR